jgi:predicted phosphodiesterase
MLEKELPYYTWHAMERKAHRLKIKRNVVFEKPPDIKIYEDFPQVSSDNGLAIWSDIHIPFHDIEFCNKALSFCKENGIKKLILNGDILDQTAFLKVQKPNPHLTFDREIESGREFFGVLLEYFDSILWVMSNHDKRFLFSVNRQITSEQFMRMVIDNPKVTITDYFWAEIDGWLLVFHPRNARKIPLSLARDMARKYRKSIINAHDHLFAISVDESGNDIIACGGYMADPTKLDYINYEMSTYPTWQHAFFYVKDGKLGWITDHKRLQ